MNKKTCKHCGYTWTPRIETEPKACPRCKSPRWSELPKKGGRPKNKEGEDMKKTMTEIMTTSLRKKLSKQGIDAIPFFTRGQWGFTHDNAGYIIDDIKDFHFVKVVDYTEKFG